MRLKGPERGLAQGGGTDRPIGPPATPPKRRGSYLILRRFPAHHWGSPLALTLQDVARLAELARLDLPADEAARTLGPLNRVLELIEALQAVDTQGVEPMTHAGDLALRLRDDAVTETDRRGDYQAVAPAVEQGLYLVPRVIE